MMIEAVQNHTPIVADDRRALSCCNKTSFPNSATRKRIPRTGSTHRRCHEPDAGRGAGSNHLGKSAISTMPVEEDVALLFGDGVEASAQTTRKRAFNLPRGMDAVAMVLSLDVGQPCERAETCAGEAVATLHVLSQ